MPSCSSPYSIFHIPYTPRQRRAFTLVELLVAATISILVMSGALYLFRSSRDTATAAQERASVLHQGRLLLEYLKRDLRALPPRLKDGPAAFETKPDRIRFHRVLAENGRERESDPVSYRLDTSAGTVERQASDGNHTFGNDKVKVREFTVIPQWTPEAQGGVNGWLDIRLVLSEAESPQARRLELSGRVHPPLWSESGLQWGE